MDPNGTAVLHKVSLASSLLRGFQAEICVLAKVGLPSVPVFLAIVGQLEVFFWGNFILFDFWVFGV